MNEGQSGQVEKGDDKAKSQQVTQVGVRGGGGETRQVGRSLHTPRHQATRGTLYPDTLAKSACFHL